MRKGLYKLCIDKLEINKKDILLDVGCGKLGVIEAYAITLSRLVVAVDINLNNLLEAKSGLLEKKAEFIRASVTFLPFKSNSINKLSMLDVLEHIPAEDELKALSEIRRVILRGSGRFAISVPNKTFLSILLDPAFLLMSHRHYDATDFLEKIKQAGLSVIELSSHGGIRYAILWQIWYLVSLFMKVKGVNCRSKIHLHLGIWIDMEYNPRKNGHSLFLLGKSK